MATHKTHRPLLLYETRFKRGACSKHIGQEWISETSAQHLNKPTHSVEARDREGDPTESRSRRNRTQSRKYILQATSPTTQFRQDKPSRSPLARHLLCLMRKVALNSATAESRNASREEKRREE